MGTIIDYLPDSAKQYLKKYDNCDLGVISAYTDTNTPEKNKSDSFDLLNNSKYFGRLKIKEYDSIGELKKVSLLLVGGNENESRSLAPYLKKTAEKYNQPYFVFKPFNKLTFDEIYNPNINCIKYDYTDLIVKLTNIRSFFSREEREL